MGFAGSHELKSKIEIELSKRLFIKNGATGSRLLAGNSDYTEETERFISALHNSEAGLLFNSGYDANLGLFSSLPQRGDTIILDELAHASIIDGARLSFANRYTFKHNDLDSLEEKLRLAKGICYVAIESVYSMDGDTAPIAAIAKLAERFGAALIVDEAHAVGLHGLGLVDEQLQKQVFARVITFGKALGCHGAIVLGSNELRQYLINYARSFIYTTAASPHQVAAVKAAYELLLNSKSEIEMLENNIRLFKQNVNTNISLIQSDNAIQCVILKSNIKAKAIAAELQNNGLDVRAILSPTVAPGSERIRICLHSFNKTNDIILLTNIINKFADA
ncbi:8-amino-7-oxononanoate synthase [Mucilaginibacter xinganensis]|uniref:8-amino-7-oxononanoate synthase n=1 Tax=Mucilaginibacter xinganensis TaxID=1234841 RepID=A0A223NY31_9SPHI|nr:8-amino-7-oxononanoate synthase [Mucilaginibacter xinganensis]